MNWQEEYKNKLVSVKEAAQRIESGDRAWVSCLFDMPFQLMDEISGRMKELKGVHFRTGLPFKSYPFMRGEAKEHIQYSTIFLGPFERPLVKEGNIGLVSIHFSQTTNHLRDVFKPNVLLATVAPPDEHGYLNFGPIGSLGNSLVADMDSCTKVIVQVNSKLPHACGTGNFIHVSKVDYICEADYDYGVYPEGPIPEKFKKIGAFIAENINDGDTLQIGIGDLGNAVGKQLTDKKDLGVHSEMFVDAFFHLVEKGVVTCARKNFHKNQIVYGFAAGSKGLHNFINRNPMCEARPFEYVNNPLNIARNDNMVAINGCMQVDILGQCSSESVGYKQYSATGGQADYIRGAALSKGGRSFMALESTAETKAGVISKIVLGHEPGTAITTPRSDVDYLVTEYGIVKLKNKSIEEKAELIISIAHPDYRDELLFNAKKNGIIW